MGHLPTMLAQSVSFYRDLVSRIHAMDEACQQCAEQIDAGDFDVLFANSCRFFGVPSIARYVRLPTVLYLQEPYGLSVGQPTVTGAAPHRANTIK